MKRTVLVLLCFLLLAGQGWSQKKGKNKKDQPPPPPGPPADPPYFKKEKLPPDFPLPAEFDEPPGFDSRREFRDIGPDEPATRFGPHVRWSRTLPGLPASALTVDRGLVIVGTSSGRLFAFNAGSGEEAWQATAGSPVTGQPVVAGDLVIAGTNSGTLLSFDRRSGRRKGIDSGAGAILTPLAADTERVVAVTSSGRMLIYDLEKMRLTRQVRLPGESLVGPVLGAELAVIATSQGTVSAVELETGFERWHANLAGRIDRPMILVHGEKSLILVGTALGNLVALELETGREVWRHSGNEPYVGGSARNGRLIVAYRDRRAFDLSLDQGVPRETVQLGGTPMSAPVVTSAGVAALLAGGRVDLFDTDLNRLDVVRLGGRLAGPAAGMGGRVYVLLQQRVIFCLEF